MVAAMPAANRTPGREGAMLDVIDRDILQEVEKYGRAATSISEVKKPFLNQRSDRALRNRIGVLEKEGLLKLEKHPGCVLVRSTRKGHVEARSAKLGGEPQ